MEFYNGHPLRPDVISGEVAESGRWFVLYRCEGVIQVEFILASDGTKKTVDFKSKRGGEVEPFTAVRFISPIAQEIDFGVSDRPLFDNDIGGLDVQGMMQVVNSGGSRRVIRNVVVPAGVATRVLDFDTDRITVDVTFNCDGRFAPDDSVSASVGYPFSEGGKWDDENTAELWVFSVSGGLIDIYEGLK